MFVVSINKEHLSVRDTNGTNNSTYGIIMQTNTISMLKLKAIYDNRIGLKDFVWRMLEITTFEKNRSCSENQEPLLDKTRGQIFD